MQDIGSYLVGSYSIPLLVIKGLKKRQKDSSLCFSYLGREIYRFNNSSAVFISLNLRSVDPLKSKITSKLKVELYIQAIYILVVKIAFTFAFPHIDGENTDCLYFSVIYYY